MPMRIVTFRVDDILYERLTQYAKAKNRPLSRVIRQALLEYFERAEKETRPYITKRVRVY